MLFFCNIASVSLYSGFGVPTTPIRLFDSYTTPLCKAPFRKNVPKLVQPGCSTADTAWNPFKSSSYLRFNFTVYCSIGFIVGILSGTGLQLFSPRSPRHKCPSWSECLYAPWPIGWPSGWSLFRKALCRTCAADDVPKNPASEPLRDAASLLLLPRPHCSLQWCV